MALSSGEISFSGLASGMSTDEMIAMMVKAESYQANKLESWKEEWQIKVDVLTEVNSKFSEIQTANDVLKDASTFFARNSSSSDSTVADVAVDSSAVPGSYSFEIPSSTKQILGGEGWVDSNTTAIASAAGTLSFDDGDGTTISVSVDSSMTLDGLQSAIDTEITNQGSSASVEVVDDGSSTNNYRLQITGATSGKGNDISINTNDTLIDFENSVIDDVEAIDFGSSTATVNSSGTYLGSVNKRITFDITSGGTVGSDDIEITWTDPVEHKSGSFTVSGTGIVDVTQGIQLNIGAGDLVEDETFAIDIFNPTIQQAQSSGLAQADKEMHSGFADIDTTEINATDGTFSYTYAGTTISAIEVSAGTTLTELVDLINNDSDNPGVQASILDDGGGSATSQHLILSGKNTGSANKITSISHTLDNFDGNGVAGGNFTQTQQSTNSMMKIDGYPAGDKYLQKRTNLVTDIINGGSVNLKSSGTTNITVSNDIDSMVDKVKTFVDAYNEAIEYIDQITNVTLDEQGEADTSQSGVLVGNYVINILENNLRSFISSPAIGFKDSVDDYTILPQVGVSTDFNGNLEIDEELLRQELSDNPDGVADLFTNNKQVVSNSTYFSHYSSTSSTNEGEYVFEANFDGGGNLTGGRYRKENESTWYTLTEEDGKYLTASKGDAKGIAMHVTWDGSSTTQTSDVRIKYGKAREFYRDFDELLDEDEGITKVLIDNYENIMENIDKRIERELDRVKQVEARLKAKYANMEVTLQEQNSQMERLQQTIASLG